jgi:hypothetical protein
LTRFWHAVEQNRRLAFFDSSTKTRPQPSRWQRPRRSPWPSPIIWASPSAQIAVHMGTRAASTAWWWTRHRPSCLVRCGVLVTRPRVIEDGAQLTGQDRERRDVGGVEVGGRRRVDGEHLPQVTKGGVGADGPCRERIHQRHRDQHPGIVVTV